jgi:hypothetical protein
VLPNDALKSANQLARAPMPPPNPRLPWNDAISP